MAGLSDFDECIMLMMQDFGTIATLIVQDDSTAAYNPITSTYEGATPAQYAVNAIFMDYTLQRYGQQDQAGTLIQNGDKQCFLQPINKANSGLTMPTIQPNKDRISVAGKIYKIASLKMVNPTMVNNIVYELHLKE